MRQRMELASIIAVTLLLLNVTSANAKNLIFVNATESAIHVTASFEQDTDPAAQPCATQYSQTIQPSDVYSQEITGCLVKQVVVDIVGKEQTIKMDIDPSSQHIDRGLFFIRAAPDCGGYAMVGPFVASVSPTRKLYFINATPYTMRVGYLFQGCMPTLVSKYLNGFRIGVTEDLRNCSGMVGITDIELEDRRSNDIYRHNIDGTAQGTLVIRKKAGTNQFEIVGPFSDM